LIAPKLLARTLRQLAAACGLSVLAFAAHAGVLNSGGVTIPGTFMFDFDTGTVPLGIASGDIFWEQVDPTTRQLGSNHIGPPGAAIQGLGFVNFVALGEADLAALSYDDLPLNGSDVGNVLVTDYVFAVRTNAGNFAKAVVSGPFDLGQNHGLQMRWVSYDANAVPEPQTATLVLLALAGAGLVGRQRRGRPAAQAPVGFRS
jgi:hypothetical protein